MRPSIIARTALLSAPIGAAPVASASDGVPAEDPPFTVGASVEALYQRSLQGPSNGITNYRGFDNRQNSFTLSNVALDTQWDVTDAFGRLVLQAGHTPATYMMAEPTLPAAAGANSTGPDLWRHVQQAVAGARFGAERDVTLAAGLFLSPIGPESMAVKDNWNWSRSNLFFGLPFYHTGAKATVALSPQWAVTGAVFNGWNSVVDSNGQKSVSPQVTYTGDRVVASALYMGGVERPTGGPEDEAWRHLFDAHLTWTATQRLSLLFHGNTGFEENTFGTSSWAAGALYARLSVLDSVFVALRGDTFHERMAGSGGNQASPIFWPASSVSSGTVTLDLRPGENVSIMLEGRHDAASDEMFFGGEVEGDGVATPFVPNRDAQDTLTLGITSWF